MFIRPGVSAVGGVTLSLVALKATLLLLLLLLLLTASTHPSMELAPSTLPICLPPIPVLKCCKLTIPSPPPLLLLLRLLASSAEPATFTPSKFPISIITSDPGWPGETATPTLFNLLASDTTPLLSPVSTTLAEDSSTAVGAKSVLVHIRLGKSVDVSAVMIFAEAALCVAVVANRVADMALFRMSSSVAAVPEHKLEASLSEFVRPFSWNFIGIAKFALAESVTPSLSVFPSAPFLPICLATVGEVSAVIAGAGVAGRRVDPLSVVVVVVVLSAAVVAAVTVIAELFEFS